MFPFDSALEQRGEMGGNMWVAIAEREHNLERARKQIWSVVLVHRDCFYGGRGE